MSPVAARKTYFLCATPRSGSAYLSHLLQQTGVMGCVDEFVNATTRKDWEHDPGGYFERLIPTKMTNNGVFGIKVHFQEFAALYFSSLRERYFKHARFLYIERGDKLAQAISFARAVRQNWWNSLESKPAEEPSYSFEEIQRALAFILAQREAWEYFFTAHAISPARVCYEQLLQHPACQVGVCVDALEEVFSAAQIRPSALRVQVQRDALNREWRKKFLADIAATTNSGGVQVVAGMEDGLRWSYRDNSAIDFMKAERCSLFAVPKFITASEVLDAQQRLRAIGYQSKEASWRIDWDVADGIVRFQQAEGLLVEPRMSLGLIRKLAEAGGAEQGAWFGCWRELTNTAAEQMADFRLVDRRLLVSNCYRSTGGLVQWTAWLNPVSDNEFLGTAKHNAGLADSGWEDFVLQMRRVCDGLMIGRGSVSVSGSDAWPVLFVRKFPSSLEAPGLERFVGDWLETTNGHEDRATHMSLGDAVLKIENAYRIAGRRIEWRADMVPVSAEIIVGIVKHRKQGMTKDAGDFALYLRRQIDDSLKGFTVPFDSLGASDPITFCRR